MDSMCTHACSPGLREGHMHHEVTCETYNGAAISPASWPEGLNSEPHCVMNGIAPTLAVLGSGKGTCITKSLATPMMAL